MRTHPLPPVALVDDLEGLLARQSCIGSMDRWGRTYFHALTPDRSRVDGNRIEFRLREAGRYEFEAGRQIVRPDDDRAIGFPDDRPYLYASGIYDVAGRQLNLHNCGPNADG